MSLSGLGSVLQDSNSEEGAAAMEESLTLCRRLVEVLGETPQTMRELTIRLSTLARIRRAAGDRAGAAAAAEEAAAIQRRLKSIGAGGAE